MTKIIDAKPEDEVKNRESLGTSYGPWCEDNYEKYSESMRVEAEEVQKELFNRTDKKRWSVELRGSSSYLVRYCHNEKVVSVFREFPSGNWRVWIRNNKNGTIDTKNFGDRETMINSMVMTLKSKGLIT